ncbi:Centrosomal protein poc5 [Rhizophlyctis rosea]|nr:Centrosomal protein poc5 [Rhizophlyctis rosea]
MEENMSSKVQEDHFAEERVQPSASIPLSKEPKIDSGHMNSIHTTTTPHFSFPLPEPTPRKPSVSSSKPHPASTKDTRKLPSAIQKPQPQNPTKPQPLTPPELSEKSSAAPTSAQDLTFDPDPSATHFAESLDKWTGMMRRAVLQDFLTAKSELASRHGMLIDHAKVDVLAQLESVKAELEEARKQIGEHERRMERRNRLVESALAVVDRRRTRSTLTLLFARWRVKQAESKRVRLSARLADRHYERVQARRCLFGWQRVAGVSWRRVVERRIQAEAEKSMEGMSVEYEKRIDELTSQLDQTLQRLRNSEVERAQAQEEMKKALMRGVCALNMEAMSMFRGGGGGVAVGGAGNDVGGGGGGGGGGVDFGMGGLQGVRKDGGLVGGGGGGMQQQQHQQRYPTSGGTIPQTYQNHAQYPLSHHRLKSPPSLQQPSSNKTPIGTPTPTPIPYAHRPHPHPQAPQYGQQQQQHSVTFGGAQVYRPEAYGAGGGGGSRKGGILVTKHRSGEGRW